METTEVNFPGVIPPPPGVVAGGAHSETMITRLILACVLCPVFAVPICGLRLYTARYIVGRVYKDDWLALVALLFAIGYSILSIFQIGNGLGYHLWDVTPAQFKTFNLLGIPGGMLYYFCTLFVKASILCFYLRFAAVNRPFRVFTYLVIFVVVGYTVTSGFAFLYLCVPIRKLWDMSVTEGYCNNIYASFLAAAAMNLITDVITLLLPIWLLWPLRVRLRQKIAVGLVLMAGGFVCFVSLYRLLAIPQGVTDPDTTWRYCINQIWCLVEMYVAIICACLPCLKAFTKHYFPGAFDIVPDRLMHERVNFSVFSVIPVQLRTWTGRRRGREPTVKKKGSALSGLSEALTTGERSHDSRAGAGAGSVGDGGKQPDRRNDEASMV